MTRRAIIRNAPSGALPGGRRFRAFARILLLLFLGVALFPAQAAAQQFDEQTFGTYCKQISEADADKRIYAAHKLLEALSDESIEASLRGKVRTFLDGIFTTQEKDKPALLSLLKAAGIQNTSAFTARILDLIHNRDRDIVRGALEALQNMDDPKVLAILSARFGDEKEETERRIQAIRAAEELGTWAVSPLIGVLKSPVAAIRDAAQLALETLTGYPWGTDFGTWTAWWTRNKSKPPDRILREANLRIRQDVLELIEPKSIDANLKALKKVRNEKVVLGILRNIEILGNRKAVGPLLDLLGTDRRTAIRVKVLDVLGSLLGKEDTAAGKALVAILTSEGESTAVVSAVVRAMGRIREITSVDFLSSLSGFLRSPNASLRSLAAESLGKIGQNHEHVVKGLVALLSDEEADVRRAAAKSLGEIRAKGTLPDLLARLGDPDPNVRWCVVSSLGQIGNPDAKGPLIKRLDVEKETRILEEIVGALVRLEAREALEKFADLIKGAPRSTVAEQALRALTKLCSPSPADLDLALGHLRKRNLSAQAVDLLGRILKNHPKDAAQVRRRLAALLAELKDWDRAFATTLEILRAGAEKEDLEKAYALLGAEAAARPAQAAAHYAALAGAVPGTESRAWTAVLDLLSASKDAAKKAALEAAVKKTVDTVEKDHRTRSLLALAGLVDPAQKRRGLAAHGLLRALVKGPAPAPELAETSPDSAWNETRSAWLARLRKK
jgi:HEAT repeat protein